MKLCTKCRSRRPLDEFHRLTRSSDGYAYWCKDCASAAVKAAEAKNPTMVERKKRRYRERHPERSAEYSRRYYREHRGERLASRRRWSQENPEKEQAQRDRYRERYPEKTRAHRAVRNAVYRGRLKKPSVCEGCGASVEKRKLHGHHQDYGKPLDVEWLCGDCHIARHVAGTKTR